MLRRSALAESLLARLLLEDFVQDQRLGRARIERKTHITLLNFASP